MHSAAEEVISCEAAAGLTRSDSVSMEQQEAHGIGVPGRWAIAAQRDECAPSWEVPAGAELAAACCAKESTFHGRGSNTLFDDLLCCRTQQPLALSACHWGTKMTKPSKQKRQCCLRASGCCGGERREAVRPCTSLSPLSTSAGGSCPASPAMPARLIPGASRCRVSREGCAGAPWAPLLFL